VELLAILIGIVILAGVGLFVSRPLVQAKLLAKASGVDASLEARLESLYTQIKELDMDHATGTVNDEDYTPMRAALVAQAAVVLKQIDGVATTSPVAQTDEVGESALEAMIAARRKPRSASAAKAADTTAEAVIAARRKTAAPIASSPSTDSPTCPKCGKPISAEDVFCAKCGTALQPQTVR
jgi:hypothetical protein